MDSHFSTSCCHTCHSLSVDDCGIGLLAEDSEAEQSRFRFRSVFAARWDCFCWSVFWNRYYTSCAFPHFKLICINQSLHCLQTFRFITQHSTRTIGWWVSEIPCFIATWQVCLKTAVSFWVVRLAQRLVMLFRCPQWLEYGGSLHFDLLMIRSCLSTTFLMLLNCR